MNVLLDTAAFLWWVTDDPALSRRAEELIRDPSRRVFLSSVSTWEIVLKHALGRLPLPEDPTALLPRIRVEHGIEELPLTEGAVLQLPKLPALHKDPFDRVLLCQAIHDGLLLVTPDEQLWRYPLRTAW